MSLAPVAASRYTAPLGGEIVMRAVLWAIGGLCVGSGILTAISGGFGVPGGDAALQFSRLGFDGLPELSVFPSGWIAIALFAFGLAMLVAGGRGAWRETGGY